MSDQNLDLAAIRGKVEKGLMRQKWIYRITFFLVHLLFYVLAMVGVWGTVSADAQVRDALFTSGSGMTIIVILPTILWTAVLLFHVASLFVESGVGQKAVRERLLMREVGEDILRKALVEEGLAEKPKRRAQALEDRPVILSDDGELVAVDETEPLEQSGYPARNSYQRSS
jgi:hypothetical protein